jgi:hypothetical protein
MVEALRGVGTWRHPTEPLAALAPAGQSALIQARARLGPEPLAALHAAAAGPPATPATMGAWYQGWRLMGIDGSPARPG